METMSMSRHTQWAQRTVITIAGTLLTGIVLAPLSLSAEHIMHWAADNSGLGLHGKWPWVVFYSLDATALVCVLLALYCTWKGEAGAIFRGLVWILAGISALANYRYGLRPGAPNDAYWFFPTMSLSAPLLLEVVLHKVRYWVQQSEDRVTAPMPRFGFARWIPGIGALQETYGAWRIARLMELRTPKDAITMYRILRPGWRVLPAVQAYQVRLESGTESTDQVHVPSTELDQVPSNTDPVRTITVPSKRTTKVRTSPRTSDTVRIEAVRTQFPDSVPSINDIRRVLGYRYEIAKRIHTELGYANA